MTNVILITNGSRPNLLEQTLRTLYSNTPVDEFTLAIVDDGCNPVVRLVEQAQSHRFAEFHHLPAAPLSMVRIDPACHIIGRLKNLGAYWSEKQFGRGDWLCFLDDDMALFEGWLDRMSKIGGLLNIDILGSVRHPFHGVNQVLGMYSTLGPEGLTREHFIAPFVEATDAVAGYCHFMRWSTWDKYGCYDAHAVGIGQSEDYALCHKIVENGGRVGYIQPPVMAHCGITASNGKPAIGSEAIERVRGVLYE